MRKFNDNFVKLQAELVVTKRVNIGLCERIVIVECQCWANAQYSTRECLEVAGIPRQVDDKNLETKVLPIFQKIGCTIDPTFIDDCHRLGKNNDSHCKVYPSKGLQTNLQSQERLEKLRHWRSWSKQRYIQTKVYVLVIEFCGQKSKDYKILVQLIISIFLVELSKLKLLKIVVR